MWESSLCAALAAFLGLRREHWRRAASAGFAAGLCRPVGVLLVLPAMVEAVQAQRRGRGPERRRRRHRARGGARHVSPVGSQPHRRLLPRPAAPEPAPTRAGTVSPFTSVGHAFHELVSGDRIGYGLHAVTAVVVVVLIFVIGRRLPRSYTVYAAAAVLVVLCARNLDSLERYSLSTFPFAIGAATTPRRPSVERGASVLVSAAGRRRPLILAFTCSAGALTDAVLPYTRRR